MKMISSPDNQVIKLARSLHHKKYRDQESLYLIEGRRLVEEALAQPELVKFLFIHEEGAEDFNARLAVAGLAAGDNIDDMADIDGLDSLDTYIIGDRLFKLISATDNPQGMAAIIRKPPAGDLLQLAAADDFLVLLDRVADPGNLGSIIRTCWALDVDGLLLTPGCADPFSPKVVRATMGGIFHLPLLEAVTAVTLDTMQSHGYELIATGFDHARDYYDIDMRGKKILALGSEAIGLSSEIISRCRQTSRIPINPKVDSLNVAAACAIIIAEAWRQRKNKLF